MYHTGLREPLLAAIIILFPQWQILTEPSVLFHRPESFHLILKSPPTLSIALFEMLSIWYLCLEITSLYLPALPQTETSSLQALSSFLPPDVKMFTMPI